LHRGTEKLIENRNPLQALPYFDRFDYVANLIQEHAFCLSVEALTPALRRLPPRVLALRTLFDELSRLLNHLLTLSATGLDLGAMGPLFWAFEEREGLMALLELVSGARMHTGLYHPGGLDQSGVSAGFFRGVNLALTRGLRAVAGAFLGLLNNRSLRSRLVSMGQLSAVRARAYGIGGLGARSGGHAQDRRCARDEFYGAYGALAFRTFMGRRGDNLDRFLLRVKETGEAGRALTQLMRVAEAAPVVWGRTDRVAALAALARALAEGRSVARGQLETFGHKFGGMEPLIQHFRWVTEGPHVGQGLAYQAAETPKGEVGVMAVGVQAPRLSRAKTRTPVSHNMHLIPVLSVGVLFADFVATFCSLDIVLGEIDR
jgi:NADH-quinone oxidoreductase subunit D